MCGHLCITLNLELFFHKKNNICDFLSFSRIWANFAIFTPNQHLPNQHLAIKF